MSRQPSVPLPFKLRSHREAHPGTPDKAAPRRTSAQVQADLETKEEEKAQKTKKRKDAVKNAGEEEVKLRQNQVDKMKNAHNPPVSTTARVTRKKRPVAVAKEDIADIAMQEPDKVAAPEPEESEDELDPSDVEESKPAKKATKPKDFLRQEVDASIQEPSTASLADTHAAAAKRKASVSDNQARLPKKAKPVKEGLRPNWETRTTDQPFSNVEGMELDEIPSAHVEERGRSSSVGSAMFVDTDSAQVAERSSDDELGGLSDDNEGGAEERKMLEGTSAYYAGGIKQKKTKVTSLAKIVPTTSVPTFVSPALVIPKKKDDISRKHLPPHISQLFDSGFVPRLRVLFGTTTPWTSPTDVEYGNVWATVYDKEPWPLPKSDLGIVVGKLIQDCLSYWRNQLATHAITTLTHTVFSALGNVPTTEEKAGYCEWAVEDTLEDHPFYYAKLEYNEETGEILRRLGIFQSPLVVGTLSRHVELIRPYSLNPKTDRPIGALVLSIQAALRALKMFKTGEEQKASGSAGHFSKANWGDCLVVTDNGKSIWMTPTGTLTDLAGQLSAKRWEKIIVATQAAAVRPAGGKAGVDTVGQASGSATPKPKPVLKDDDSDTE